MIDENKIGLFENGKLSEFKPLHLITNVSIKRVLNNRKTFSLNIKSVFKRVDKTQIPFIIFFLFALKHRVHCFAPVYTYKHLD